MQSYVNMRRLPRGGLKFFTYTLFQKYYENYI